MKRILMLLLFMILIFGSSVIAQEKEEEPLPPPKHASAPKLGGAIGFTPNWLFFDVGPINEVLRNANAAPFDKDGMLLLGGQGYGYIMVVKNLRVGWMSVGGRRKSTSFDMASNTRRDVELSVGFGGVTIDYVIPILPRLDAACGILLGSGGMDIRMTRDNGNGKIWEDLWYEYGTQQPAQDYSRKLSGSFFVYQPSVNLEYALLRWVGLRVGVSYVGMAGGDWKLDDKYDVFGVPDKINGKGWMLNGGIFLGTFIF